MGWLVGTSTRTPTSDIWITAWPSCDRTLASRLVHTVGVAGSVALEIHVGIRSQRIGIGAHDHREVSVSLAVVQAVPEHVRIPRKHLADVAEWQRDDAT